MSRRRRSNLVGGILLILLGALFLALQLVPGLGDLVQVEFSWPLIIVGVGVFLLVFGLLAGAPGMAVPACIVGGIGPCQGLRSGRGLCQGCAPVGRRSRGDRSSGSAVSAAGAGDPGRDPSERLPRLRRDHEPGDRGSCRTPG